MAPVRGIEGGKWCSEVRWRELRMRHTFTLPCFRVADHPRTVLVSVDIPEPPPQQPKTPLNNAETAQNGKLRYA